MNRPTGVGALASRAASRTSTCRHLPIVRPATKAVARAGRMSGTPAAGGSSPARRRDHDKGERVPLFASPGGSPMGSLKHRTGGSFTDVLVPGAAAADSPGGGQTAQHAAAGGGLSPAVMLCVAVASMGERRPMLTWHTDSRPDVLPSAIARQKSPLVAHRGATPCTRHPLPRSTNTSRRRPVLWLPPGRGQRPPGGAVAAAGFWRQRRAAGHGGCCPGPRRCFSQGCPLPASAGDLRKARNLTPPYLLAALLLGPLLWWYAP